MCGRSTLRDPSRHPWLREAHGALAVPRFNIAPSQPIAVVGRDRGGATVAGTARWGFHPRWLDSSRRDPINARAETVAERPLFRAAFAHGRCLVPADGWYEWQAAGDGPKQPHFLRLADERPFVFAGVATRDADGERTAAILTAPAHGPARDIHARLPLVIAGEDDARAWLEAAADPALIKRLLAALRDLEIGFHPVGWRVNRPANDDPGLVEPA